MSVLYTLLFVFFVYRASLILMVVMAPLPVPTPPIPIVFVMGPIGLN